MYYNRLWYLCGDVNGMAGADGRGWLMKSVTWLRFGRQEEKTGWRKPLGTRGRHHHSDVGTSLCEQGVIPQWPKAAVDVATTRTASDDAP